MSGNHALVFGASGIIGWAITNVLISGYPDKSAFSQVTAVTNRPLTEEIARWPPSTKFQIVSGLDLLTGKGQEGLDVEMEEKIININTVTHVYFCAYIMDPNLDKERSINVQLLDRAVNAMQRLSPRLQFVVLPTGTKAYGVHVKRDIPFRSPLVETMPRIPEPHRSRLFYYGQVDLLSRLCVGKAWKFCEITPDVIVGFVPNNNVYNLAQLLATFLSLYVALEGHGADCPFPGTEKCWMIKSNDSSQDIVAKFAIHASLHSEITHGKRFNIADSAVPRSWSEKWPIICEYFCLNGTPPPLGGSGPKPVEYLKEHMLEWKRLEKEKKLQTGRVGNTRSFAGISIMTTFDFDRDLNLTRMHEAWGTEREEIDVKGAWWKAFDRYRKAKIFLINPYIFLSHVSWKPG